MCPYVTVCLYRPLRNNITRKSLNLSHENVSKSGAGALQLRHNTILNIFSEVTEMSVISSCG